MWEIIRKTSPPVLLMAVLLFAGVGYSLYKAATAFSVEVDSPAYDRTPSDVIVSPELETVIPQNDPTAIRSDRGGFRLPDKAIFDISAGTFAIGRAMQKDKLTAQFLSARGYTGRDPESQARYLKNLYNSNFNNLQGDQEMVIEINNDFTSEEYAQSSINLSLLPEDGSRLISLNVYIGWERAGQTWRPAAFSQNVL